MGGKGKCRGGGDGRFLPAHPIYGPFWSQPRHLGVQIRRCYFALGRPITSEEAASWAYSGSRKPWHGSAVLKGFKRWGFRPVGKRGRYTLWLPPEENTEKTPEKHRVGSQKTTENW